MIQRLPALNRTQSESGLCGAFGMLFEPQDPARLMEIQVSGLDWNAVWTLWRALIRVAAKPSRMWGRSTLSPALTKQLLGAVSPGRHTAEGHGHK